MPVTSAALGAVRESERDCRVAFTANELLLRLGGADGRSGARRPAEVRQLFRTEEMIDRDTEPHGDNGRRLFVGFEQLAFLDSAKGRDGNAGQPGQSLKGKGSFLAQQSEGMRHAQLLWWTTELINYNTLFNILQ